MSYALEWAADARATWRFLTPSLPPKDGPARTKFTTGLSKLFGPAA